MSMLDLIALDQTVCTGIKGIQKLGKPSINIISMVYDVEENLCTNVKA